MIYEAVYHEASSNYSYPSNNNEMTLRLRVSSKDSFKEVNVIYEIYDYSVVKGEK